MSAIRIAGIIEESITDGPGYRYTIFTQGCKHNCKGCHNPETWNFNGGKTIEVDRLYNNILKDPLLEGITFSGGDPMYQPLECMELASLVKLHGGLTIWCYTGFTYEEVLEDSDKRRFLEYIDVLVDGPFVESEKSLDLTFKGSRNQRIIDVKKSLTSGEVVIYNT